jgi:pimeloyl-ACP methyl ester carboxylesterase
MKSQNCDMDLKLRNRLEELSQIKFNPVNDVCFKSDLHVYDINYYQRGLDVIEYLNEGEIMVGNIKLKRDYVTKDHGKDTYLYHTHLRIADIEEHDLKATLLLIHGFGENSDQFLESALHYAINGLDVHLIDLTGYGYSSGIRLAGNTV